jgi:hypothetical protein
VEWEFKAPESPTRNAIDKALRNASKQADRVLLHVNDQIKLPDLEQALYDRVRRAANLLAIAVLYQNQLYHFDRQEITNNTFRGKIK